MNYLDRNSQKYSFSNMVLNPNKKRYNSAGRILLNQYNPNTKPVSSTRKDYKGVQSYLDRRHKETQEKIQYLRNMKEENKEFTFRPKLSDASKKIIEEISRKEAQIINVNYVKNDANLKNFNDIKQKHSRKPSKVFDETNYYKQIVEKRDNLLQKYNNDVK